MDDYQTWAPSQLICKWKCMEICKSKKGHDYAALLAYTTLRSLLNTYKTFSFAYEELTVHTDLLILYLLSF